MKMLVLALLFVLPQKPQINVDDVLDYGVQIHIIMANNEGSGSGVFVANDLILTANHNWSEGAKYYIDDKHLVEVTVVKRDTENDLMLLRSTGEHKHASLGNAPNVLDEVYATGYPLGQARVIVKGSIANTKNTQFLVDATVVGGMSGGAVFDSIGRLIGICVMSWGDSDTKFMVAVSINTIRKFIDK